jgi:hypothetical protein
MRGEDDENFHSFLPVRALAAMDKWRAPPAGARPDEGPRARAYLDSGKICSTSAREASRVDGAK